jgi:hypothetical protein
VLKPLLAVGHYDGRTFGALMSRGLLGFFTRCQCGGPCVCECNNYHITKKGKTLYRRRCRTYSDLCKDFGRKKYFFWALSVALLLLTK